MSCPADVLKPPRILTTIQAALRPNKGALAVTTAAQNTVLCLSTSHEPQSSSASEGHVLRCLVAVAHSRRQWSAGRALDGCQAFPLTQVKVCVG